MGAGFAARDFGSASRQRQATPSVNFALFDQALLLTGDVRRAAAETICKHHYTHSVSSGKSHYVQFREAVVIWSLPANNNLAKFILGWKGSVWELSRLWAPDGHDKNLLTQAISKALG